MSRFRFSLTNQRTTFTAWTLVTVIATCSLGLALAITPSRSAQAQNCPYTYVVKVGDNLYRIALADGVSWPVLQQLNGILNPNLVFAGQTLCLPNPMMSGVTPMPTVLPGTPTPIPTPSSLPTVTPIITGSITLPPPGIFPSIGFDHTSAAPGDTITVTGINFPTNSTADVFIKPLLSPNAYAPVSQTTTSATGTINFSFTIPTTLNGQPLQGYAFSVLVRERTTGYYGFSFFYNSRGY